MLVLDEVDDDDDDDDDDDVDDVDDGDPQAAPNKHNVIPSAHRCRSRIHNLRSRVQCEAEDTKGARDFGQHFVWQ